MQKENEIQSVTLSVIGDGKRKRYEDLTFLDDFMFGKVLTTHLDITKELIEMILDIKIARIEVCESQKSLKFTPFDKGVRFDIYQNERKK